MFKFKVFQYYKNDGFLALGPNVLEVKNIKLTKLDKSDKNRLKRDDSSFESNYKNS